MIKEEFKAEAARVANEHWPEEPIKAIKFVRGALWAWPQIESLQKEVKDRENEIKEQKCNIEYLNIKLRATENQSKRIADLEKEVEELKEKNGDLHIELEKTKKGSSDWVKASLINHEEYRKTIQAKDQLIKDLEKEVVKLKESSYDDTIAFCNAIDGKNERIKELEGVIKEQSDTLFAAGFHAGGLNSRIKELEEQVKNLTALGIDYVNQINALKNKWISVKDRFRLPPTGKYVLVYHSRYRNCRTNYLNSSSEWMRDCNGIKDDVTHWMPLPEPPKPLTHE